MAHDDRETGGDDEARQRFLRDAAGRIDAVDRLQGDASTREYWRVRAGGMTYILCHDGALPGNGADRHPFLVVYRLFSAHAIPVPTVLALREEDGLLLLEDCGDTLLEDAARNAPPHERSRLYRGALDILIRIQSIPRNDDLCFHLSFDFEKLMFEFDFFIEHALCRFFGFVAGDPRLSALREEFAAICAHLVKPELFVLNHRDYHSRNIMVQSGNLVVIDFQDARMGLPQYDCASLLRDSYLSLPDEAFNDLKDYYFRSSLKAGIHAMTRDGFDRSFDLMAFQRNVKALGTFGYQSAVLGRARYRDSIAPTIAYLHAYCERRAELKKAWKILQTMLPG